MDDLREFLRTRAKCEYCKREIYPLNEKDYGFMIRHVEKEHSSISKALWLESGLILLIGIIVLIALSWPAILDLLDWMLER